MNKKSFSTLVQSALAKKGRNYPLIEVNHMIDAFLTAMQETVSSGEKLQLTGYFSAYAHYVPATTRRNPKTGEPIEKPATHTLKMKPGNILKTSVANLKKK